MYLLGHELVVEMLWNQLEANIIVAIAIAAEREKLRYTKRGLSKLCIAYMCVCINKLFQKVHCGVVYNNIRRDNITVVCVTTGKCRLVKIGRGQ